MTWTFGDLSLGTGSAVPRVGDKVRGLDLELLVSPTERFQLAELCARHGRYAQYELAGGDVLVVDTTGDRNTLYLSSGASGHTVSGWFVVSDYSDDWSGPTKAVVRLGLVLIAAKNNDAASCSATTQFVEHDF